MVLIALLGPWLAPAEVHQQHHWGFLQMLYMSAYLKLN